MKSIKVIVPILALLAFCLFYWPERPTYIPKKLWGLWQTDQEPYADRYLDISEAIFTIGQSQQQLQVFFIHQVKMDLAGRRERYTLYYRDRENTDKPLQTFTFYFQKTATGDRLQLKNQHKILWYRAVDLKPAHSDPNAVTP